MKRFRNGRIDSKAALTRVVCVRDDPCVYFGSRCPAPVTDVFD